MKPLSPHGQPAERALILGLGDSGWAAARWLARQGTALRVWDSRDHPPHQADLLRACPQAELITGSLDTSALEGVSHIIKTPGWPPHRDPVASLCASALQRGVPVWGEWDLFEQALQSLQHAQGYCPKLLCVTGTNGKTTTTAWTAHLLREAGVSVRVAGNIGPSLLDALMQALDAQALPEVWVLELSSFQLHDAAQAPRCRAAAVTNLTPDHLDWHGSLQAYAQAKRKLLTHAEWAVLNHDDAEVRTWEVDAAHAVRVGVQAPERAADLGLIHWQGDVWLAGPEPLMPVRELPLRGRHNAVNALMALALARCVHPDVAALLPGLRNYVAEPHRLQPCGQWRGVSAFDDSKGTNVGATVAALEGLGAELKPGKLVVILGGDGKGQRFDDLRAPIQSHARAVALIGRDAGLIAQVLQGLTLPVVSHPSLAAAVAWGFAQGQSGDALLLSPACASWDMFKDYGHRGKAFAEAVAAWSREHSG